MQYGPCFNIVIEVVVWLVWFWWGVSCVQWLTTVLSSGCSGVSCVHPLSWCELWQPLTHWLVCCAASQEDGGAECVRRCVGGEQGAEDSNEAKDNKPNVGGTSPVPHPQPHCTGPRSQRESCLHGDNIVMSPWQQHCHISMVTMLSCLCGSNVIVSPWQQHVTFCFYSFCTVKTKYELLVILLHYIKWLDTYRICKVVLYTVYNISPH